eukprot:4876537-Prymnesium_polylepis.2
MQAAEPVGPAARSAVSRGGAQGRGHGGEHMPVEHRHHRDGGDGGPALVGGGGGTGASIWWRSM